MEDQESSQGSEPEVAQDQDESVDDAGGSDENVPVSDDQPKTVDPLYVQKRLKRQKREHQREIREMQARMAELQAQVAPQQQNQDFGANPYTSPNAGIDETISKAVNFALRQKEEQERKVKAAEASQKLSKEYANLQQHLDKVADKYDDFDEIVRGDSAPFTETMRDAALMLPKKGAGSAGEVLYQLGKNPENLERISKLYPHEQAAELIALSHALISGGEHKGNSSRPLGQVKSNPVVNSAGVTEKTSPAQIRALMKAGKFK